MKTVKSVQPPVGQKRLSHSPDVKQPVWPRFPQLQSFLPTVTPH